MSSTASLKNDFDKIEVLKECPEPYSSVPSHLLMSWFTPLAWKGFKRQLQSQDIWSLPYNTTTEAVCERFNQHWLPCVEKLNKAMKNQGRRQDTTNDVSDDNGTMFVEFVKPGQSRSWSQTLRRLTYCCCIKLPVIWSGRKKKEKKLSQSSVDLKYFKSCDNSQTHQSIIFSPNNDESSVTKKSRQTKKFSISILPSIIKTFWSYFLLAAFLKLIHDGLTFSKPLLQKWIISFSDSKDEPFWHGIFYCILLLIFTSVQSVILSQYFYIMYKIGMRMRSALLASVYRKALCISLSNRRNITSGNIINLMSVDIQHIVDLMPYINMLWGAPLQIGTAIAFLWQLLGPSSLAGCVLMVLLIPINGAIAAKNRSLEQQNMKKKDERMKCMNEVIRGIKILKFFTWEEAFMKEVNDVRGQEVNVMRKIAYLQASTSFIWSCAPFFVSLVTFATYVYIDPANNVLDAETAFVSLSLFNILRFPLSMMPMMIASSIHAHMSLTRLNAFMNGTEVDTDVYEPLSTLPPPPSNNHGNGKVIDVESEAEVVFKLENATFAYNTLDDDNDIHEKSSKKESKKSDIDIIKNRKKEKSMSKANGDDKIVDKTTNGVKSKEDVSQLSSKSDNEKEDSSFSIRNLNFEVCKGELVAIIGQVGAGKSTLINALLGEVSLTEGHMYTSSNKFSVAYVAQESWIQNASIKQNIRFGGMKKHSDDLLYGKCLSSCALGPDLRILEHGDNTEIGEKGVNLSGGQKQRISLARAAYFNADVYLLDDPLSAVDTHVGEHIFTNLLSNNENSLLKDKTRVLVTHGIHHLSKMDRIVIMKDGVISEQGSYKQLLESSTAFAEFLIHTLIVNNKRMGSESESAEGSDSEEHKSTDNKVHDDTTAFSGDESSDRSSSRRNNTKFSFEIDEEIRKCLTRNVGVDERAADCLRALESASSSRNTSQPIEDGTRENSSVPCVRKRFTSKSVSSNDDASSPLSQTAVELPSATDDESALLGKSGHQEDKEIDDKEISEKSSKIAGNSNLLYGDESRRKGSVKLSVYMFFLKSMGFCLYISSMLSYVTFQAFSLLSSFWLSMWSDEIGEWKASVKQQMNESSSIHPRNDSETERPLSSYVSIDQPNQSYYLSIYALLGFGQAFVIVIGSLLLALSVLRGSKRVHGKMLQNIFKLKMEFFDTTPSGRILNRFGKDLEMVDTRLATNMRGLISCFMGVLSSIVVISYVTPHSLLPISLIAILYYFIQRIYVATSRDLKRLESVGKSPIYTHFGESISGIQTIRAFKLQNTFATHNAQLVDAYQRVNLPSIVSNRWLSIRLEVIVNIIIFVVCLVTVFQKDVISAGLVGLTISYVLSVTQTLNWLVRMSAEVETNFVAVERLKEYTDFEKEAVWSNDLGRQLLSSSPSSQVSSNNLNISHWPSKGKIEFQNLSTRYRFDSPVILNGVSFTINGCEKVGVVGRTGAGKSSLTLSLFRIIEAVSGCIKIDGVDISTIGLHDLRSCLTIIPQDPVLFSGTIRFNLDPLARFDDKTLWNALQSAHLKEFISSLNEGLDYLVYEGGQNLSVGQRQLICLARAITHRSHVLVMDEATAAIDLTTDDLIQKTIRTEFKNSTVLTIAHRISTIMDYDKVLVMEGGQVKEFDTVRNLLERDNSDFHAMCKSAGLI